MKSRWAKYMFAKPLRCQAKPFIGNRNSPCLLLHHNDVESKKDQTLINFSVVIQLWSAMILDG